MGALLFSHFRVMNVKMTNEKKSRKYYSLNVCIPLEIDTNLVTSCNNMSWGCPGMLKSRSGMGVVFSR